MSPWSSRCSRRLARQCAIELTRVWRAPAIECPSASWKVVECPPLGGLAQPWLADLGEGQRAVHPEDGQIPDILVPFGFRVPPSPPGIGDEAVA